MLRQGGYAVCSAIVTLIFHHPCFILINPLLPPPFFLPCELRSLATPELRIREEGGVYPRKLHLSEKVSQGFRKLTQSLCAFLNAQDVCIIL